jgi:predicted RNA-binding protein associated with RNAse of E/G family
VTRLTPGTTVVRRDLHAGRVWSEAPRRVISDDAGGLLVACWPGVRMRANSIWVDWLLTRDDSLRGQALAGLGRADWRLVDWTWRDTYLLTWYGLDPDFSVHRFFRTDGTPLNWYVNFERPLRFTPAGFDTLDLLLDIDAAPDLSTWTWKDEDEYEQGRRLGIIDDADHHRIQDARERAVHMIDTRGGPFADGWSHWEPHPGWPVPSLSGI